MWSIGCILYELYTGDLLFPTHDDEEQLFFMEKSCGYFPDWMVKNAYYNNLFNLFEKCHIDNKYKLNIVKCKNPRCITSVERGLKHICVLKDKNTAKYRCKYCDAEV